MPRAQRRPFIVPIKSEAGCEPYLVARRSANVDAHAAKATQFAPASGQRGPRGRPANSSHDYGVRASFSLPAWGPPLLSGRPARDTLLSPLGQRRAEKCARILGHGSASSRTMTRA
ncbi:hypothetical protein MTO96_016703 [Rhipicephalus appendiculatus]